jgi:aspartyl-tRNA(Asn)/glutamyl-tRNA(Gln) amidotransferase subunit C
MRLTREEVAQVAWLARLALTEAESERYADQLSGVLSHVERLQALDVSAIEPTAMAVESDRNITRPDEPGAPWSQDAIVANAPDSEGGAFRVRAILEESA